MAVQQNAPQLGAGIGSGVSGALFGFDATPPPTASDAAYVPEDELYGTIANDPAAFVAHGVSVNDLGSFPGGARASQISPDLTGPQIVSPARSGDGYGLRGAGTPELMQGQPPAGPIRQYADRFGVVRLGIGPAVPLALLVVVGLVALYVFTHPRERA